MVECPSAQGSSGARTSVVCTTEQGQVSEQLPAESATGGVLWKKMFLEILQNSQENTSARASFLKVTSTTKLFFAI